MIIINGIDSETFDSRTPVAFASLPPAANNTGRIMLVSPLVVGQNYFRMVSDGTFWRPLGGMQLIYQLAAQTDMAANGNAQLLFQIPLPALLLPDARTEIKTTIGVDKLNGTSDTCTFNFRVGSAGTVSDSIMFNPALATTNIDAWMQLSFRRITDTTVRKIGAGGSNSVNHFSNVSAAARPSAITVADMDTTLNYYSLFGTMTSGATEIGSVNSCTVELMG